MNVEFDQQLNHFSLFLLRKFILHALKIVSQFLRIDFCF